MAAATFQLTGDKELDAKFLALPKKLQKSILRQALRPATKLIHEDAKSRIPARSGQAKKSLKVRAGKRSRKSPNRVSLQVVTEGGFFTGKSFYLSFVEFGWKIGSRKAYTFPQGTRYKLGNRWIKERKQIEGKHYIKQAFDAKGEQAKSQAIADIKAGIEAAAAEKSTSA